MRMAWIGIHTHLVRSFYISGMAFNGVISKDDEMEGFAYMGWRRYKRFGACD